MSEPRTAFAVKAVADRYGVAEHTVLGWIKTGELRAVNVGTAPGKKKPRWRITQVALEAFEAARTAVPVLAPRRKRSRQAELIEFYK